MALALAAASLNASSQPAGPLGLRQAAGQPASTPAEPAFRPITAEQVQALRDRLGELEGAARDQATAALDAAGTSLQRNVDWQAAVGRFQQDIDRAPAALESSRAALAAPAADPAAQIQSGLTLADLEQLLTQARAQLEASRGQLAATEAEPGVRQRRRDAIPGELAEAQAALEETLAALAAAPDPEAPALVTESRLLADRAAAQAASSRVQSLQRDLASLEARRDNLQARLDLARRQVAESEALFAELDRRASESRRAAAQAAEQSARAALLWAADAHPRVQEVLQFSQRLAARLATDRQTGARGAQDLAQSATHDADAARAGLDSLRADYRSTLERLEAVGLTDTMGRLLRENRRRLESPLDLRDQISADRVTRSAILLELFELRPLEAEWGQPEQVARAVADRETILSPEQRSALQTQLQAALIERLRIYRSLVAELETYQAALGRLDESNRARLALLTVYIDEIDRTILWVPSHHAVNASDPAEIATGLGWLNDPAAWTRAVRGPGGLLDDVSDRPIATLGPVLLVLLLALVARPALSRTTDAIHERARRVGTDSFALTLRALLLGTIIAGVPPALLLTIYLVLSGAGDAADQARAVGMGCLTAAGVLFAMTLLGRVVRRNGLAEVHFRWPEPVTAAIRSKIRWLLPLALATHPIISAMMLDPDTPGGPALARLALVIWLIALALGLYRLLRPNGPPMRHFLNVSPGGWLDRLRWIWYPAAFLSPLALAFITLLGYIETARELEARYLDTIGLALLLILVSAVVTRWITLARRRVAMEQARRRREALDAEHAKELGVDTTARAVPPAEPEPANLKEIDSQTRQLLRFGVGLTAIFGIWGLWVGVLPALGMLERVELWPQLRLAPQTRRFVPAMDRPLLTAAPSQSATNGPSAPASAATTAPDTTGTTSQAVSPSPATPLPTAESSASSRDATTSDGPFTLADLLTVFVLALATLVASRNLPGVVEILLLQHLPLDRGSRYAVTTIFRYTILIIGVSATLNAVGIGWGKVQWLAAALTFGLGFGLQEIFANFVSGLIILAERPVRIGDTVTVNGVTGNVTRIRMRATTIADYDKRELIVPNRLFITDSVINWSLSDPTTRVVVPVGVAYGSDINLVRDTLLKAGRASSYLLEGKEPAALFRAFGPSALEFELRIWTRNIEESHLARDDVLRLLDRALREAKIEVAFPQQDVHIRTINMPPPAAVPPAPSQGGPASRTV